MDQYLKGTATEPTTSTPPLALRTGADRRPHTGTATTAATHPSTTPHTAPHPSGPTSTPGPPQTPLPAALGLDAPTSTPALPGTPAPLGPGTPVVRRRAGAGTGPGPGGHRVPRQGGGPPRRRDQRRPGGADPTARHRARERLPRYWFANRLLLTLSGQRPVHWMLGHTQDAAYDQLVELAPHPTLCPSAAGVAERLSRPPVVRHCDEFRPEPWIIEAFARIAAGDRLRALAFRLERGQDDRWRCAAIDLGGVPGQPARQ